MNQTVRIYAAITTDMVKHVKEIFNMWPSSLDAFGRLLTISSIMSATYKSNEALNIIVNGDGPIGKMTVEAKDCKVRGFVSNPGVFLQNNDGTVNITKAVGNGEIEVIKDLHLRQPFSSSAELISGDIANDFTYYFATSEQIPSSVGLGVSIDPNTNDVIAAGGFLIQVMPGCKEEYINKLDNKLKNLKPTTKMIKEGYSAIDIINEITDGDYELLETKELKYECNCSKDRFKKGLKSLGKVEIENILNEDKKAEIVCNFCNKKYVFNEDDLKEILFEL